MILFDTDHTTLLKHPESERGTRLMERLKARPSGQVVAVSIVTVDEQMRGWLASIAKERLSRPEWCSEPTRVVQFR